MLTKSIRKDINFRLGSHLKYTCAGVYYYDKKQKKFVICEGPCYWVWVAHFYGCFVFETLLFLYLWNTYEDIFETEFDEETGEPSNEKSTKLVILFSGMLYWVLITGIVAIMSVTNEFREELCYAQNQIFKLDEQLLKFFVKDGNLPELDYPEKKHAEWLIRFVCFFPQSIPVAFTVAQFIPGEPLHSLLEWVLEIKFGLNWETLLPWSFLVVGTNTFVAMVITASLFAVSAIFSWLFWLRAACPNILSMRKNWDDGLLYFRTAQLGVVSETELIWLYRALQLQTGLVDRLFATSRGAYHAFAQQVTMVIAMFTMIRFGNVIFSGTSLGFTLAAISVLGTSLAMLMMIVESFGLDEVQKRSSALRDVITKGTKRSMAINKTVRSFKEITIHSAGSYYKVNKSSYLEWCDQAIDRLVNLLCSL